MQSLKKTFNRFSLDQKVLTLIVIEILGFGLLAFVAVTQLGNVGDQVEQIEQVTFPLHIAIEDIHTRIYQQRINAGQRLARFREGSDNLNSIDVDSAIQQYGRDEISIMKGIESTEELVRKVVLQQNQNENALTSNSEQLLQILFDLRRAIQVQSDSVAVVSQQASVSSEIIPNVLKQVELAESSIDNILQRLTQKLQVIRTESIRHAVYIKRIAIGFTVLTLLGALLFFIAMLLLIVRRNISKPLQLLTDTINAFTAMLKVEESEFEKGLMVRRDELGRMSRSFNRLKHDLWNQGQDLHDAKEEAEQANHAKSMFLAAASHDLRQPLQAMQMYIAALRQKVGDQETLAIVDDIDAVSTSTARLLSALLDVSQLEAGAIEPSFECFPVDDVLHRIWREFLPFAKQKGLEFRMVRSGVHVRSDPVLLERILGNFMSNAIRYTQKGRILMGVRRRSGQVSIEVWDTGLGIPDDQMHAIFQDFHQIDNEERDRSKGLGLGLAIAERLAICLSHEIACDSQVDKGSRFAVLVPPVEARSATKSKIEDLNFLLHGLHDKQILLIEDDLEVLKATRQLLESWGCIVIQGTDRAEVLAVVKEHPMQPPDLILADNRLPGGAEGVVVASEVRNIFGMEIPCIIVTGDVQEGHLKEIASHGYRVLSKPVQPAKLRSLMSNLLENAAPKKIVEESPAPFKLHSV